LIASIFGTATVEADNCPGSDEYCDTLGGVNLAGSSTTLSYTEYWEGGAGSSSSQNITTISAATTGWEYCDGNWHTRWSDSESDSNGNYVDTYGWNWKLPYCSVHYCETDTQHGFYKSGVFGANPFTYDQVNCP
jgi:hypothetical protein